MSFPDRCRAVWLYAPLLAFLIAITPVRAQQGSIDELVVEILHEVVDGTRHRAREQVRAYAGLDLLERGYRQHAEHRRFPSDTSGEIRRELRQMQREHDREIEALERELDRKLDKARAEFKREAAKEAKPGKVREKRRRLEEKVNAAYARFDEKVSAVNARSDEKRERILSKARGNGGRHGRSKDGRSDEGRGPPDEPGRGNGRGLDDLKL